MLYYENVYWGIEQQAPSIYSTQMLWLWKRSHRQSLTIIKQATYAIEVFTMVYAWFPLGIKKAI